MFHLSKQIQIDWVVFCNHWLGIPKSDLYLQIGKTIRIDSYTCNTNYLQISKGMFTKIYYIVLLQIIYSYTSWRVLRSYVYHLKLQTPMLKCGPLSQPYHHHLLYTFGWQSTFHQPPWKTVPAWSGSLEWCGGRGFQGKRSGFMVES
jgi:hypothetical protein